MRVFIATLATETNAFSPLPCTMRAFERGVLHFGDATRHPPTLFTEALHVWRRLAEADGAQVVESLAAMAQPCGLVSRSAYESLRQRIVDDLSAAGPVDAILLMLHGAMAAQGYDDCEGDIVSRVRAIAGGSARIGVLLDLHASVSRMLLEHADIVTCCHLYPHTDFGERAQHLYAGLRSACSGATAPIVAHSRIDMLGFYPTSVPSMQRLVARMGRLETRSDVLAVSLVHGFPWSDSDATGAGVIVVTDDDSELAAALASELAEEFSHARTSAPELLDVNEALDRALASPPGPIVIADVCDNPGGGAPGDSTFLLNALLSRHVSHAAVALMWDPGVVDIATDAGQGARIALRLGGKIATTSGPPLDVEAEVIRVLEEPFQLGLDEKSRESLGRSVLLNVGGVKVVVNSLRQQVFGPECFTQFGIDPGQQRILVVKSSQHFARQFEAVSRHPLYCRTPGCLSMDFAKLPYRKLRRPMWPIDTGEPSIRTELIERQAQ